MASTERLREIVALLVRDPRSAQVVIDRLGGLEIVLKECLVDREDLEKERTQTKTLAAEITTLKSQLREKPSWLRKNWQWMIAVVSAAVTVLSFLRHL